MHEAIEQYLVNAVSTSLARTVPGATARMPARRPAVNALQRSEIIAFFVGKDGPRRNRENAGPAPCSVNALQRSEIMAFICRILLTLNPGQACYLGTRPAPTPNGD